MLLTNIAISPEDRALKPQSSKQLGRPSKNSHRPPTVAVVMGTRPEVIKLASVIRALLRHKKLRLVVIGTGQHKEMFRQALKTFGIEPDVDLALMEENQSLAGLVAKAIPGLDSLYAEIQPSVVLVQGDTATAMSAAVCAFYRKIPVAHVEAG